MCSREGSAGQCSRVSCAAAPVHCASVPHQLCTTYPPEGAAATSRSRPGQIFINPLSSLAFLLTPLHFTTNPLRKIWTFHLCAMLAACLYVCWCLDAGFPISLSMTLVEAPPSKDAAALDLAKAGPPTCPDTGTQTLGTEAA